MKNCEICGECFASSGPRDICPACERALKRLEGYAEPVRHGRWVFMGLWEECSGCGYAISVDDKRTNYCPNCGAKMDGGDKNEQMDQR